MIREVGRQAVLLAGLALLPALAQALHLHDRISWQPPAADEVTVSRAKEWGDAVMWLDARPIDDFNSAHIPRALPLNTADWDSLLGPVLNSWSPARRIVVYCSRQSCDASREVARRLRDEAGLKNIYVLTGGWEAWQESGK
ncbi:MAG: hypothetical protein DLM52_04340 [Chthoniobacterales bacterium]|nr:MAG: hypothetical protein DLM52_04340 [Chthoniobacterales bacterium]PZS13822.1 MAG: hypothetical protein DLM60_20170 [Pseudonocardiales bacterium]